MKTARPWTPIGVSGTTSKHEIHGAGTVSRAGKLYLEKLEPETKKLIWDTIFGIMVEKRP